MQVKLFEPSPASDESLHPNPKLFRQHIQVKSAPRKVPSTLLLTRLSRCQIGQFSPEVSSNSVSPNQHGLSASRETAEEVKR